MPSRHRGSAKEVRALDAYIKLMRAAGAVTSKMNRNLDRLGLTESQFGVLEALYHVGPLHQCEIATKLLKSGGNITMVLDNLQRRGFIIRKTDDTDRRRTVVELTAEGRSLISRIFPAHAAYITEIMNSLTADQQSELGNLCRILGTAALQ